MGEDDSVGGTRARAECEADEDVDDVSGLNRSINLEKAA